MTVACIGSLPWPRLHLSPVATLHRHAASCDDLRMWEFRVCGMAELEASWAFGLGLCDASRSRFCKYAKL